ncbi:MAG: 2-hydroxychromene-2-carboxylate isomerase [Polyangiaceae bacterium]
MSTLDFYFDYSCPYAYLGSSQVEALARTAGRTLRYKPMLLGGVFHANGTPQNLMNILSPAKAAHNVADMNRFAKLFDVELSIPSTHPMRTVEALRATLLAECDPKVIQGFFRAYWVDHAPISEEAVVRRVLTTAGKNADAIWKDIASDAVKNDLRARTDEAVALGIFGAPAYVVDGELYWGQDRVHFVAKAPWESLVPECAPDTSRGETRGGTARTLEVYWDFSSPFAYLGVSQAEKLAARTGAKLIWRPMLLGGLFKTIGQVDAPLATFSAAKQAYYAKDLLRWAEHWGVPFQWPSRFPMNTVKALRCYLAIPEGEARDTFRKLVFQAFWGEDRDISDDAVLRELIGKAGVSDADAILAKTQDPAIKNELIEATKRAADAGVFGAPTWVVDGQELFWGQDRLFLVERALTAP